MEPRAIVVSFDIGEQIAFGLLVGPVSLVMDQLGLEAAKNLSMGALSQPIALRLNRSRTTARYSQPSSVGLAPVLAISGRVAARGADGRLVPLPDAAVVAVSSGGERRKAPLDKEGRFTVPADRGPWTIEATASDGRRTARREVTVGQAPVRLSALVPGEEAPPRAPHVRTVDFETATQYAITKMPNGYAGLQWTNLLPVEMEYYESEGFINNVTSGHWVAYNTSGYPVAIAHPRGFDFRGGHFGLAHMASEGEILEVRAWRGDRLAGGGEHRTLGPRAGPLRCRLARHHPARPFDPPLLAVRRRRPGVRAR
jgi:hypothetical protein